MTQIAVGGKSLYAMKHWHYLSLVKCGAVAISGAPYAGHCAAAMTMQLSPTLAAPGEHGLACTVRYMRVSATTMEHCSYDGAHSLSHH